MNNEPTNTEFELFDAAFAEATSDLPAADEGNTDPAAPAEPPVTELVAPATAAEAVAAVETPEAAPATAAEAVAAVETPEAAPAPAVDTPAPAADSDYQKKTVDLLEQLVKKGTSPGESSTAHEKAPDISQAQESGTDPEPFKLSDEQVRLLKTYDEEWPEVAKASDLRTQMAIGQAVGALVKQLRTELAPMFTHYVKTQGNAHFSAINAAHTDFDALKPQVQEWIAKQPAGLRTAYQSITKTGSAEDVIELFNVYKKSNGIGVTPQQSSADARVTVVKTPAPEVQRAAASLTVVPGKRAVIPKGSVDADDFDGAWSEATSR